MNISKLVESRERRGGGERESFKSSLKRKEEGDAEMTTATEEGAKRKVRIRGIKESMVAVV